MWNPNDETMCICILFWLSFNGDYQWQYYGWSELGKNKNIRKWKEIKKATILLLRGVYSWYTVIDSSGHWAVHLVDKAKDRFGGSYPDLDHPAVCDTVTTFSTAIPHPSPRFLLNFRVFPSHSLWQQALVMPFKKNTYFKQVTCIYLAGLIFKITSFILFFFLISLPFISYKLSPHWTHCSCAFFHLGDLWWLVSAWNSFLLPFHFSSQTFYGKLL